MTVARTAAEALADHVTFEIEWIDRMYLNVYQPRLQYGAGVSGFFVRHRGYKFASTALMAPMTAAFVTGVEGYVAAHGLDLVRFKQGQRKDDVAHRYLAAATRSDGSVPEGVLFVGVEQEKARVWHTVARRNP